MPQIERPLRRKRRQPLRGFEDQRQTLGQVDRCRHGRSRNKIPAVCLRSAGKSEQISGKQPPLAANSRRRTFPLTALSVLRKLSCRRLPESGAKRGDLTLQPRGVRRLLLLYFACQGFGRFLHLLDGPAAQQYGNVGSRRNQVLIANDGLVPPMVRHEYCPHCLWSARNEVASNQYNTSSRRPAVDCCGRCRTHREKLAHPTRNPLQSCKRRVCWKSRT